MSNGNDKSVVQSREEGNPDIKINTLLDLPLEVLVTCVLNHLSALELAYASATCTAMREIVASDGLLPQSCIIRPTGNLNARIPTLVISSDKELYEIAQRGARVIVGHLEYNRDTTSIDLPDLEFVTGSLTVENCTDLKHIFGLNKLRSIGGALSVSSNKSLKDVKGFNALTRINESVIFAFNDRLTCISGFDSIICINKKLRFLWCDDLISLQCMNALVEVGESLSFSVSGQIDHSHLFPSLKTINGKKKTHF